MFYSRDAQLHFCILGVPQSVQDESSQRAWIPAGANISVILLLPLVALLRIKPRALHTVDKHSTTEHTPGPEHQFLKILSNPITKFLFGIQRTSLCLAFPIIGNTVCSILKSSLKPKAAEYSLQCSNASEHSYIIHLKCDICFPAYKDFP